MKLTCVFFLGKSSVGSDGFVSSGGKLSEGGGIESWGERGARRREGVVGSTNVVVSFPASVMTVCVARRVCLIVCILASSQTPASAAFLFFKLMCFTLGAIVAGGR